LINVAPLLAKCSPPPRTGLPHLSGSSIILQGIWQSQLAGDASRRIYDLSTRSAVLYTPRYLVPQRGKLLAIEARMPMTQ